MKPLNECLHDYMMRRKNERGAPRWLLFHDTDEYMFPENGSLNIPEALEAAHGAACCTMVSGAAPSPCRPDGAFSSHVESVAFVRGGRGA